MFNLACQWKHGRDVHGRAQEYAQGGDVTKQQIDAFKKELRSKQVQQLTNACGAIVANNKGKCRQSCSARWGEAMAQRSSCVGKCLCHEGEDGCFQGDMLRGPLLEDTHCVDEGR